METFRSKFRLTFGYFLSLATELVVDLSDYDRLEASFSNSLSQIFCVWPLAVAASLDNPYSDCELSRQCAKNWGSDLKCVGAVGHINANSTLGEWVEGQQILARLVSKVTAP